MACSQRSAANNLNNDSLHLHGLQECLSAFFKEIITCIAFKEVFVDSMISNKMFYVRDLFNEIDFNHTGFFDISK
jgi:hypothetical protein